LPTKCSGLSDWINEAFQFSVNFFVTTRHVSRGARTIESEEGLDTDPVGQSDPAKGSILEPTGWENLRQLLAKR
jgi:hypothetical protein